MLVKKVIGFMILAIVLVLSLSRCDLTGLNSELSHSSMAAGVVVLE